MRIALGCDHAGTDVKDALGATLAEAGHQVDDCGCQGTDSVDYPDFAEAVARRVAGGDSERGILICGTGIGMSIAANKVAGVRAAKVNDPEEARLCRAHNDANVICVGARVLDPSVLREVVTAFLEGPFEGGRHARRVDKINGLD
jgi:ribose 5-phosphate isomerase B